MLRKNIQKMAKEDIVLPLEMEKLEIQPAKFSTPVSDKNPFQHKNAVVKKAQMHNLKPICPTKKYNKYSTFSKNSHKILKEPVLKLFPKRQRKLSAFKQQIYQYLHENSPENDNLSALVHNCNQLNISPVQIEERKVFDVTNECIWLKNESLQENQTKGSSTDCSRPGPSCSQQALNPPCDVTIDELASYFETLVHIPKKMSSMAEMMYI